MSSAPIPPRPSSVSADGHVRGSQTQPRVVHINRETQPTAAEIRARDAASEALLLRNRRLKLGAGATFVVVIAASLFGAQLKEVYQSWQRRRDVKAAADLQLLERQATQDGVVSEDSDPKSALSVTTPTPVVKLSQDSTLADREILRHIALLEDRRAMLNRQRGDIVAKIKRIEDRQARNAEMEARRAGSGFDR